MEEEAKYKKISKTSNELDLDDLKSKELDYCDWANVIDSLENSIKDNWKALKVNIAFLAKAIKMQSMTKPPELKKEEDLKDEEKKWLK